MVKPSPAAVLSVSPSPRNLSVGLFALEAIDDELVIAGAGGKEIFRERLKLKTADKYKREIALPEGSTEEVRIRLGQKLVYETSPSAEALRRPLVFKPGRIDSRRAFSRGSPPGRKARDLGQALAKYLACLEGSPSTSGP